MKIKIPSGEYCDRCIFLKSDRILTLLHISKCILYDTMLTMLVHYKPNVDEKVRFVKCDKCNGKEEIEVEYE